MFACSTRPTSPPDRKRDGPYSLSELSAACKHLCYQLSVVRRIAGFPVPGEACACGGSSCAPRNGRGAGAALGLTASRRRTKNCRGGVTGLAGTGEQSNALPFLCAQLFESPDADTHVR
jgi:hypothetical protein